MNQNVSAYKIFNLRPDIKMFLNRRQQCIYRLQQLFQINAWAFFSIDFRQENLIVSLVEIDWQSKTYGCIDGNIKNKNSSGPITHKFLHIIKYTMFGIFCFSIFL